MESRVPAFSDLTFNTIGKAPSLLGRLSSPGPSVTALPASPSPSPQPITRMLAASKPMSKSRPSLLESLGASASPADLFIPSPGHDSVSQPRSNGSNVSQLQYPPTPPTDFPPRMVTTLVEQPPLSSLSALKDRLSSIATSFQPANIIPTFNLARSSREQSIIAHDSARRAVALSLDSIQAAQASSTAAQESFTAAEKADALSSDLLVSLDELYTQLQALDSLNSIHDISTELSVWVAREESSRAAQHSSRTSESHQSPTTSSGFAQDNPQPAVKVERDVHMTSSDAPRQLEPPSSTSLFPTIPSDIPIDDDLLDEKESLGKALAEIRRERENIERIRRDTEDAELARVKQRLLDAMRGADQFEEELNRARRSREAAAREDYESQTRQCLEDARKAKEARRESAKAAEEEAHRKAALCVAEEEAKLKAEEEAKYQLAQENAQKETQAATRLKLEQKSLEERRRLEEAAAQVKLQRQMEAREVQEKAEKERQAEFEEKRREVKERRARALLQNAQEAQKFSQTKRISQSPVRNTTPSTVPSISKPAKPNSSHAISGGVSLGHPPATRNETLPTEPKRSIPLQHSTPSKLPPSLPPKPQQALSSRNNLGGPGSNPGVSLIHYVDGSRGRSSSESDEYVPWSIQGNNGNVPLLPFQVLPSVQQFKLPHIGSPSKDQATKNDTVVSKTEPVEVSVPPPPLPHRKALQSSAPSTSQNAAVAASSQSSSHIVSSQAPHSQSSIAPAETLKSPWKKGPPGVTTLPQKSAAPHPQQTKKQAKAARRAEQLRLEQAGGTTSNQTNSVPIIVQSGVVNGKQDVPAQQSPLTSQSSGCIDQHPHASATQSVGGDGGWGQFNGQTQPQIAPTAYNARPPTEPRSRRTRGDHYSPSPDRYAPAARDRDPQPSLLREVHYYPTVISGQKRPRDIDDDLGRADSWETQRRRSDSPSLMHRLDTSDDFAPMDYGAPRRYVQDSPPRELDSPRGGGYRHLTPPPPDGRVFYPANNSGGSALLGRISTNGKQPRAIRGGAKRGGVTRGGGPNYHMRGNMSAPGSLAQRIRDGPPHGAR
ncbi:hypothetical protein CPB85DRAFT_1293663 [Mucidula mucida]|nr:hypothetical protein CPB85DRAFT_1293663 [Mucidula mucida]